MISVYAEDNRLLCNTYMFFPKHLVSISIFFPIIPKQLYATFSYSIELSIRVPILKFVPRSILLLLHIT